MKFDSLGFINMEQDSFPGSVGDSCAETSRWVVLSYICGEQNTVDLTPFLSPQGLVRYPSPPCPWGAGDTSDDQLAPFIAASALIQPGLLSKVISQTQLNGWRTGNGQLLHPTTFSQILRAEKSLLVWLCDFTIFIQALIFLIPLRWSDSAHWFELTDSSSADYLNFVNFLALARAQKSFTFFCWLALQITPLSRVQSKIHSYYAPEPNNDLILDLYDKALPLIYGKAS